jgi:hypothetical protein
MVVVLRKSDNAATVNTIAWGNGACGRRGMALYGRQNIRTVKLSNRNKGINKKSRARNMFGPDMAMVEAENVLKKTDPTERVCCRHSPTQVTGKVIPLDVFGRALSGREQSCQVFDPDRTSEIVSDR